MQWRERIKQLQGKREDAIILLYSSCIVEELTGGLFEVRTDMRQQSVWFELRFRGCQGVCLEMWGNTSFQTFCQTPGPVKGL